MSMKMLVKVLLNWAWTNAVLKKECTVSMVWQRACVDHGLDSKETNGADVHNVHVATVTADEWKDVV